MNRRRWTTLALLAAGMAGLSGWSVSDALAGNSGWLGSWWEPIDATMYEKAWGMNPARWKKDAWGLHFNENGKVRVQLITSSAIGNIFWPGEKPELTLQFANLTDQPLATKGVLHLYQWGMAIGMDDMWKQSLFRIAECGTMPGYIGYHDSDYIFALNPVAQKFGGGTEVWRLKVPGLPRKHFYPRQPKSPLDGPVAGGKLAITRDGNTRIVECAIPWSEIPEVKRKRDAGETVKFSFRINDSAGLSCLELARDRSVSKRNSATFRNDWDAHWANEVEFGWER